MLESTKESRGLGAGASGNGADRGVEPVSQLFLRGNTGKNITLTVYFDFEEGRFWLFLDAFCRCKSQIGRVRAG